MTLRIYYIWLLLLPYSWIIAHYTGVIALDKMLAPLLLIVGLPALLQAPPARRSAVLQVLIFLFVFMLLKNVSFLADMNLWLDLMWVDAIKIGYFAVPILYITSMQRFRVSGWIIVISAAAGLITVFMVALGWLVLPLQRFEITRIGVETLQKSIGIFPSYGDLAQYVSFTIGFIALTPGVKNPKASIWRLLRLGFVAIFFIGLIGAQSRNLLMSALISAASLYFLARIARLPLQRRQLTLVFVFIFGLFGLAFGVFFIGFIIDILSGIGGGLAQDTASARLAQFDYGWQLISSSPLWGINAADYAANPSSVDTIHNLWIKLTAKSGIFTTLLFLIILWRIFSRLLVTMDYQDRALDARVVITYFFVMVFSTLFYPAMGEAYWALLGVASALVYVTGSPRGVVVTGTKSAPKGLLVAHRERLNA